MLKRCLFASFLTGSFLVVSCGSGQGGIPTAGSTYQPPGSSDQSPPGETQAPPFNPQGPGGAVSGGDPCSPLCNAAESCGQVVDNCIAECRTGVVLYQLIGCSTELDAALTCFSASGFTCDADGDISSTGCESQTQALEVCLETLDTTQFGPTCTLPDNCGGCIQDDCDLCMCATGGDTAYCDPICSIRVPVEPCTLEGGCQNCAGTCEQCLCASPEDPTLCTSLCGV